MRIFLALAVYMTIAISCGMADLKKWGWPPIVFFGGGAIAGFMFCLIAFKIK